MTVLAAGDQILRQRLPFYVGMIAAVAVIVRLAAALVLNQPLESDGLAYFTMAQGFVEHGVWADHYGQHAFYSAGYPLIFVPFFWLFGSSVATVLGVNALLAVVTIWLIVRVAQSLSHDPRVALLAAALFALWLPAIWNATLVAKENVSTPLVLGIALFALKIARNQQVMGAAFGAGLCWGAALVTGGSALLLCAGVGVALLFLWQKSRFHDAVAAGLVFSLSAALIVGPWLYATAAMVGRPVLTTNAAFNLYLGNNPAATGRFVSIADTPLGKDWDGQRLALGEVANADRLQTEAVQWIGENPGKAAMLALRKLAYFWEPNVPTHCDFARSKAISSVRIADCVEYALLLIGAALAFFSGAIQRRDKAVIAALIAGFWLVHAPAYIIVRYRDPVMPLVIIMAAVTLVSLYRRHMQRQAKL